MININDYVVLDTLNTLQKHGESVIFGGYVRDVILNIKPKDIDIATTITPEEVNFLFPYAKYRETISGFKVFSFSKKGRQFEIVPDSFPLEGKSINADLNINSLLYDGTNLIDKTNSLPDFDKKVIKNLPDFQNQIKKNSLIWIKPFRLSSITGFTIDRDLLYMLQESKSLFDSVNSNIKIQEGYKIINSDNPLLAFKYLSDIGLISGFDTYTKETISATMFIRNYPLRLVYLTLLTSEMTTRNFISLFEFPHLINEQYNELLNVYLGNRETTNFRILNQKIFLDRVISGGKKNI